MFIMGLTDKTGNYDVEYYLTGVGLNSGYVTEMQRIIGLCYGLPSR